MEVTTILLLQSVKILELNLQRVVQRKNCIRATVPG